MSVVWKWVEGQGMHYGLPNRDLTKDEFEQLDPKQQRTVRLSPCWIEGTTDRKKATAEEKSAGGEG